MSSRVITALAFLVGVILVYSAVKNKDPVQVVKSSLKGGGRNAGRRTARK